IDVGSGGAILDIRPVVILHQNQEDRLLACRRCSGCNSSIGVGGNGWEVCRGKDIVKGSGGVLHSLIRNTGREEHDAPHNNDDYQPDQHVHPPGETSRHFSSSFLFFFSSSLPSSFLFHNLP